MLVKPKCLRYQWIYEPQKQFLILMPLWQDIDTVAKNVLSNMFTSLELDIFINLFQGKNISCQIYECLADESTFLSLIQQLKPKWVTYFGELTFSDANIYQFPHPNTWQKTGLLKKRIWLAWHDLKYKVL